MGLLAACPAIHHLMVEVIEYKDILDTHDSHKMSSTFSVHIHVTMGINIFFPLEIL